MSGSGASGHIARTEQPSGSRLVRWTLFAAGLLSAALLVALLAYGVLAQIPDTSIDASLAGGQPVPAPPFRLAVLQRGGLGPLLGPRLGALLGAPELSLRELRGTPVVLNFYASWCLTCQAEATTLERVWRKLARPRGVLFLAVDIQDSQVEARAYLRRYGIDYPNVRDPSGDVAELLYQITGVPETFFVDAQGQIVGHIIGISSASELAGGIGAALAGRVSVARSGGAERLLR